MRNILLVMGIFLFSHVSNGQNSESVVKLFDLGENLYSATISGGSEITQKGFYKLIDGELIRHGIWKLYSDNKLLNKGEFVDNRLVWIESDGVTYTDKDIELHRLRKKVAYLERESIVTSH